MPELSTLTDGELVRKAQAGEETAFDELMVRYEGQIIGLAYRMLGHYHDSVEVAQEAFYRVYRGLAGFRREASFRTWLYGITLNLVRHKRRWHIRHRTGRTVPLEMVIRKDEEGDSWEREIADPKADPRQEVERSQLQEEILQALEHLPGSVKTVVILRDIQDVPYEEIARLTKEPVGTVKSRLHRGRAMLRELLKGK
ncbi:MAG: sigma-70 family RNA polymerase sigma factor [Candidatus Omnitrophica bacterium]|nr:sigma-70 family RNA polymerase sigma factor [Candidatus Omnitrophota bacterium]